MQQLEAVEEFFNLFSQEVVFPVSLVFWQLRARNLTHVLSARELAEQLGFEIVHGDLPWKVGGYPKRLGKSRYIVINECHPSQRQDMTILHEIAHYYMPSFIAPSRDDTLTEFQADLFALIWIRQKVRSVSNLESYYAHNPEIRRLIRDFGKALLYGSLTLGVMELLVKSFYMGEDIPWIRNKQSVVSTPASQAATN